MHETQNSFLGDDRLNRSAFLGLRKQRTMRRYDREDVQNRGELGIVVQELKRYLMKLSGSRFKI